MAQNVEHLIFAVVDAFYQADVVFASQNMGAGQYSRIKKASLVSHISSSLFVLLLSLIAYWCGRFLMGIYTSDPVVIDAALARFRITGLSYVFCCLMNVVPGTLRGIGYNMLPMLVTLLGACGLRLLWIATVFQFPQYHTIEVLYYCYPISWFCTALAHFFCFFYACKHLPSGENPVKAV